MLLQKVAQVNTQTKKQQQKTHVCMLATSKAAQGQDHPSVFMESFPLCQSEDQSSHHLRGICLKISVKARSVYLRSKWDSG